MTERSIGSPPIRYPSPPYGSTLHVKGHAWAIFSDPPVKAPHFASYRYVLGRELERYDALSPTIDRPCVFIMCNPSTASHVEDDPTIRRCTSFAIDVRCDRLIVVNLFALRATDMKQLELVPDPCGELNAWALRWALSLAVEKHGLVIAAWGNGAKLSAKFQKNTFVPHARAIRHAVSPMHHLGLTADGQPSHPLFLSKSTKPTVWV